MSCFMHATCCVCVCVCGLSYQAYYGHALHCRLWPAPVYNIFLHYLKRHIKKKKLRNTKCVLIFSTNLSETFLILRTERDMVKNV